MLHDVAERCPEEGACRCRQSDESECLPLVEVELCQPEGAECCQQERGIGHPRHCFGSALLQHVVDEGCRSKSEGDAVCQRVKLLSDGAAHVQQTCGESVAEVECRSEDDEEEAGVGMSGKCLLYGNASADEVAAGDGVWYMSFHEAGR